MAIEEDLQFIEDAVKRLRREYDLFFSGAAKLPPFKLRMEADRRALEISRVKLDKLAPRFKVQAVMGKYSSCTALWDKQMKLRESGIRDPRLAAAVSAGRKVIHELEVGRLTPPPPPPLEASAAPAAARPIAPASPPGKPAAAAANDAANVLSSRLRITTPGMAAVKTASPAAASPVPAAAPPAPAPAAPKPGPADASLRTLFDEYNQLRVKTGEKTTSDLEKFAAMIEKKKAELAQKGSKNVAFGVALKDGRVILKAKTGSG